MTTVEIATLVGAWLAVALVLCLVLGPMFARRPDDGWQQPADDTAWLGPWPTDMPVGTYHACGCVDLWDVTTHQLIPGALCDLHATLYSSPAGVEKEFNAIVFNGANGRWDVSA